MARARSLGPAPTLHPIGAITMGQKGAELTEMADLKEARRRRRVGRRALRDLERGDAPRPRVRQDLRPPRHPARRGPRAHRGRADARGRDRHAARAARLAPRRRGHHRRARRPPRRGHGRPLPRRPRLLARRGAHPPRGEGARRRASRPRSRRTTSRSPTPRVLGYDTACKVNPPLREQADVDALREALADGTIDAIATDHAPHSSLEKDCEFSEASPGMIGLELVVPVLLELVRSGAAPARSRSSTRSRARRRASSASIPRASARARVAELVLVDPEARGAASIPARLRSKSAQHAVARADAAGRGEDDAGRRARRLRPEKPRSGCIAIG